MSLCFLNGDFLPVENAQISVMDRGFVFGDGVYEVLPVYEGRIFRLPEHLRRLKSSLAAIGIENAEPEQGWAKVLEQLVGENGGGDQSLYVQVTRGCAPRSHIPAPDMKPTLFAQCEPHTYLTPLPVSAVLAEDFRWARCDIKSTALLASVLLKMQADAVGAGEAILHRDGLVTEGSVSNVFVVYKDSVRTPPISNRLLAGITRSFVIELCSDMGLELLEESIPVADLFSADELWVSSSTRELVPVVKLDDKPVGSGIAGPQWQRIYKAYYSRVREA